MTTEHIAKSLGDRLFVWSQYILPHHLISRFILWVTRTRISCLKRRLIPWFIRRYNVDMSQAKQSDWQAYATFNDFFTRELTDAARPVCMDLDKLACPVDGAVSEAGYIADQQIFQAKGFQYTLGALLGGEEHAAQFKDGAFATLYLSPRDYHRIHMPLAGTLKEMIRVPGRLFSVNPATVRAVPNLFARNERVVSIFDTAHGPMALILVGAINVACIETVWHGVVTPPHRHPVQHWVYTDQEIALEKGAHMGTFNMGSTVIMLFAKDQVQWDAGLQPGTAIQMGQALAGLSDK